MAKTLTPTTIVIFGASGDLTRRKLIPALFSLHCKNRLPENFNIVGFAASKLNTAEYRVQMDAGIAEFYQYEYSPAEWESFASRLHYLAGDFSTEDDYIALENTLVEIEGQKAHRLYYLATPPRFFAEIVAHLGSAKMVQEELSSANNEAIWRRVIIEKPFGHDLTSAKALNQAIRAELTEHQIYRIDHYLAKETVQNILFFRFGNTMFEPLWNCSYVDHVQITVAEDVDIGHRGGYYDQTGVLRDMFQNHLMQLLALVSMEPPASFTADAIRNEKVKALSAVRPVSAADIAENTVRAQYRGYREAHDVSPDSQTPTYAAVRLYIDNWRWKHVPFYLRSGKALARKTTEIIIQFGRPPNTMLELPPEQKLRPNFLALCIQPHEGFHQRFEVKVPNTRSEMRSVDMDFHYDEAFGPDALPDANERLMLDALRGDATLFTRNDGIETAWKIIDPILKGWENKAGPPLTEYDPGSEGPELGDTLLTRDGRKWRHGCAEHE